MREFIKKLFAKPEPETLVIPFESLPPLLDSHGKEARSTLGRATLEPARTIRAGSMQLLPVVQVIENAEHDPAIHPKLKSIAKNTLPQFVRSMKTALAKELPDDPEEFYPAAVDMVKGCVNSMRGPGRYLVIVFPEEMKTLKGGIDAMGHEINALTAALADYRRVTGTLEEARRLYAAIGTLQEDCRIAKEKDVRATRRVREATERIAAIGREQESLHTDTANSGLESARDTLQEREVRRDATARAYASLSMTASHVFRKAEKIAARKKHPGEISALRHAMEILSSHDVPGPEDLKAALAAASPIVSRMIEAGEIPLKNKEERAIFHDTPHFITEICGACTRLADEDDACRKAREALDSHPLIKKAGSLDRERIQLTVILEKETADRKEREEWVQKTGRQIPAMQDELAKMVGAIMGKNVQWQDTGEKPA